MAKVLDLYHIVQRDAAEQRAAIFFLAGLLAFKKRVGEAVVALRIALGSFR